MTKRTQALFDLSTLISPAAIDIDTLKDLVVSKDTPWDEMIEFANQSLLIPALYDALQQKDLLKIVPNKTIVEYLSTVYKYNRIRNEALLVQVQEICHLLAEISVTPVLLKGVAALSEEYYHSVGARVMIDIDILVQESEILQCVELLMSKGRYQLLHKDAPLWGISGPEHHYHRIYTENGVGVLEVHRALAMDHPYLPNEILMKHVKPSKRIENAYVIEPSFEFYHSFLHSEVSHEFHENKILALRHLHHAAVVASASLEEIDWDILANEVDNYELSAVWEEYLYMHQRLFGLKVPSTGVDAQEHFKTIIYFIEKNNSIEGSISFYMMNIKNVLSYKTLQKRYDLKSKLGYPLALVKSLFRIFFKYAFSSKFRKEVVEHFVKDKKNRKYGH